MALVLADRVKDTTTTTGTGTVTLSGTPPTGFQAFSVIGDGNTTYYAIVGGSEWEVGVGTYTASGTTLARTTVLESSNSGSLVNFSAGTKDVFVTNLAPRSDVQTFTSVGTSTWTKPTWAEYVQVILIGGGGGGGSGARSATNAQRGGGGGGGGGGLTVYTFQASDLPDTVSVTVGAGGTGGAASSGTGASATGGTATTFSTILRASGGSPGGGGALSAGAGGAGAFSEGGGSANGASGGAGSGGFSTSYGGPAGGGGGALSSANQTVSRNGGTSSIFGPIFLQNNGTTGAGANGTSNIAIADVLIAAGGAGGGYVAGQSASGGNGGSPGGGGGGGSCSDLTPSLSGAGGAGGIGWATVVSW